MEPLAKPTRHLVPYPVGVLRLVYRLPLVLHRFGLGWLLAASSLGVLTTRGRISQLPRHTVLEFRKHGSKYYAISGWGERPQWYRNLLVDPEVTLQLGARLLRGRAVPVENRDEALRAIYMFRRTSPVSRVLLNRMSSVRRSDLRALTQVADEFTVVRFEVEPGDPVLPGVPRARWWVLPTVIVGLLVTRVLLSLVRRRPGRH